MVTVPPALPVTEPPSTEAISGLEEDQTTSPEPPVAVSRPVSPAGMVISVWERVRGPSGSAGGSGAVPVTSGSGSSDTGSSPAVSPSGVCAGWTAGAGEGPLSFSLSAWLLAGGSWASRMPTASATLSPKKT